MPFFLSTPAPNTKDPNQDWVKGHWCSNFEIATLVAKDLTERFGCSVTLNPEEDKTMHLDYGGCLLGSWKPERIGNFSFMPHQLSSVIHSLHRALANPREGGYIKLHGAYVCICLSEEEGKKILADLQLPDMLKAERNALEDWDRALPAIKNHPNIHIEEPNGQEVV